MSSGKTLYYFLKSEFLKNPDSWFTVRELACEIDLSVNRTRTHLTGLVLAGLILTKTDKWCNVYRYNR